MCDATPLYMDFVIVPDFTYIQSLHVYEIESVVIPVPITIPASTGNLDVPEIQINASTGTGVSNLEKTVVEILLEHGD